MATIDTGQGVRLLGVGVSGLGVDPGEQLSLDLDASGEDPAAVRTDDLLDEVRARFGNDAIGPASAAVDGKLRVKRRGEQQWGPNATDDTPEAPNG